MDLDTHLDPYPDQELTKIVAGSGINHSGSTTHGKKGTVLLGSYADQFKGSVYLKTEDDDEKDAVGGQQDSRLLYCAAVAEKAKNQENKNRLVFSTLNDLQAGCRRNLQFKKST